MECIGSRGLIESVLRVVNQILGLGTHLFVQVPRPGDSEVTFSVFESSCHLLLYQSNHKGRGDPKCIAQGNNK